jgi:P27 family predicted phage terminase small subunit
MASKNGPNPEPTAMKIAKGNPGKRSEDIDLTREAQPDLAMPEMPDFLDQYAKEEWDRIASVLLKNKLLTVIDGQALGVYCQAWSRMKQAEMALETEKYVVIGGTGGPIKNPLIAIINQQAEIVFKFLLQFGMTPSARAKIKFPKGSFGEDESEWEKFKKKSLIKNGPKAK